VPQGSVYRNIAAARPPNSASEPAAAFLPAAAVGMLVVEWVVEAELCVGVPETLVDKVVPGADVVGMTMVPGTEVVGYTVVPGTEVVGYTVALGAEVVGNTELEGTTMLVVG